MRVTGLLKITSIVAASLLVLAQAGIGQSSNGKINSSIKVTDVHGRLTVQITKVAHVREILEAICQSTNVKCDIAPALGETDLVAPMVASGEWSQVIPELLEGSRVNYSFTAPTPRQPGQLFVQARAAFEEPHSNPVTPPMAMEVATPIMSNSSPSPVPDNPASEVADGSHDGNSASPNPEATTQVEAPSGTVAAMPFPGNYFIPSSQSVPNVTPFSDAQGNPIQVQVTNEHPTVLPFSDSQGRPLPAPAVIPGQKLEYPIPPTPR